MTEASTPAAPDPSATPHAGDPFEVWLAGPPGPAAPTRFELGDEIARGGMGEVYAARDTHLGRDVAVKVLQPHLTGTVAERRFWDEARITGQLQHPGIPPVYDLGTLPDGRPFLAMKLVRGGTLADLLRCHGPGVRWLPAFERVCDAVGYAHAHRIIHRDLKPGNVMVGGHGEVQVMDWGLAKPPAVRTGAADPEATEPGSVVRSERTDATRPGTYLGTPAYMAPEQAIGAVGQQDARTDVFGLGAVLCALLTGAPPYRGVDAEATRLLAARCDLTDAFGRLDGCGADPEVVALCKRCLAPDPAARPADGGAVAEAVAGLRAAADERARAAELAAAEGRVRGRLQLRLGGLAAAVLLLGTAGTGYGLWRTTRALTALTAQEEQTQQALARETEQRLKEAATRAEAITSLRLMSDNVLGDIMSRRASLTPADRRFLVEMQARWEALAAADKSLRVEGLARVGDIFHTLGDYRAAEGSFQEAVRVQAELAAERPSDPVPMHDLAALRNQRANVLADDRPADAERELREALALFTRLVAEHPGNPDYAAKMAYVQANLGNRLRDQNRTAEAEAAYEAALAVQRRLAADRPQQPEYRHRLGRTHKWLAILQGGTARRGAARSNNQAAIDLFRPLVVADPGNAEYALDLAGTLTNFSGLLAAEGHPADAEHLLGLALTHYDRLVTGHPGRPIFRYERGNVLNSLGNALDRREEVAAAEQRYRQALAGCERLLSDYPTAVEYRHQSAVVRQNLAGLLDDTSRVADAERLFREAIALWDALTAKPPALPEHRHQAAATRTNLGRLLEQTGRPDEGEREYRAAAAALRALVREHPAHTAYRHKLARALLRVGAQTARGNRTDEAETTLREVVALLDGLIAPGPGLPEYRLDLADAHAAVCELMCRTDRAADGEAAARRAVEVHEGLAAPNGTPALLGKLADALGTLAGVLAGADRTDPAEAYFRQALDCYGRLRVAAPGHRRYRLQTALTQNNMAHLLKNTGRPKPAKDAFRAALAELDGLLREVPDGERYRTERAAVVGNLGLLMLNTRREAESVGWFTRSIDDIVKLHGPAPQQPAALQYLRNGHYNRALALFYSDRVTESLPDYDRVVELSDERNRPRIRAERATALSQAGRAEAAVREADELTAPPHSWPVSQWQRFAVLYANATAAAARPDDRDRLAGRAVEALRKAVAGGWRDRRRLETDPGLASLRDLPGFRVLVNSLPELAPSPRPAP